MALIKSDDMHAGDEARQLLEREIAALQDKLSRLPETFNQSLIPMTQLYQEILQQRLSLLQNLEG
jgi:hypothetical protein